MPSRLQPADFVCWLQFGWKKLGIEGSQDLLMNSKC
jgi:hypothetical protein